MNLIPVSYRPNRPTRTIILEAGTGKPGQSGRKSGRSMIFRAGSTELLSEADANAVKADAARQGIAADFTFGPAAPAPAPGVPAMKGAPPLPLEDAVAELERQAGGPDVDALTARANLEAAGADVVPPGELPETAAGEPGAPRRRGK